MARKRSRQNAMEWARMNKELLTTGKVDAISVVGSPGPSFIHHQTEKGTKKMLLVYRYVSSRRRLTATMVTRRSRSSMW